MLKLQFPEGWVPAIVEEGFPPFGREELYFTGEKGEIIPLHLSTIEDFSRTIKPFIEEEEDGKIPLPSFSFTKALRFNALIKRAVEKSQNLFGGAKNWHDPLLQKQE